MKKILLIITVLLLTGCSINYRIEINEDNTFNEIVSFTDSNDNLSKQNINLDIAFNELVEHYKLHEGIYPGIKVPNNFKRNDYNGTSSGALVMKNETLKQLDLSIYLNRFFDTIELDRKNNVITLYFYDFNYEKLSDMLKEKNININTIKFRIKCPYKVKSTNSTYYDEDTNEYIWVLTKDTSIKFKYTTNEKNTQIEKNNNSILDNTIGKIIYFATGIEESQENDKKVKKYSRITLFAIILVMVLIAILVTKKRINKSDQI